MKKSQIYALYTAAAALSALIAASLLMGGKGQHSAADSDTAADSHRAPSYDEIVGEQQKRWGHGHTLSDPSPASVAAPITVPSYPAAPGAAK